MTNSKVKMVEKDNNLYYNLFIIRKKKVVQMKLNEKLIKLRKENGLSQEEFSNMINVSRQSVSKWENGEVIPDVNKITEIVKKFNVSYDYLLNDEIESEENNTNISDNNSKKPKSKKLLRIILIIFLIYLLTCIYKFIAFYQFYSIANSFSEKNYWMVEDYKSSNPLNDIRFNTTKVNNKIINSSYPSDTSNAIKDENGNIIPNNIEFTDIDKKISYDLYYDKDKNMYIYHDRKKDMINDEEIEGLFTDKNIIKETTLSHIPSGFKEIFLASIDPRYYYVSIVNRQFRGVSFLNNIKIKVQLNNDYLVERVDQKYEYNGLVAITFSYDYVQDHFDEIIEPSEKYNNKILYEEE